jgi:hypothetical protein
MPTPMRWQFAVVFCRPALSFCLILPSLVLAQEGPPAAIPALAITTESLPQAALAHAYRVRLEATGVVTPLHWSLTAGSLPDGLELEDSGIISGTATRIGNFRFSLTVTDSDKPSHSASRELAIRVVTPLRLEWSRYPTVQDNRIDGAVKVSNDIGEDFDFTLIAVAVNEIGKAFALGYQHFDLPKDTPSLEIAFGSQLPQGSYVVHVDAVGEVPSRTAIYRQRLHTLSPLEITVGP